MLGEIEKTWKTGRWDATARNELVRTLREVSELDAGQAVIDLLKHGVSTTPPARFVRTRRPRPTPSANGPSGPETSRRDNGYRSAPILVRSLMARR